MLKRAFFLFLTKIFSGFCANGKNIRNLIKSIEILRNLMYNKTMLLIEPQNPEPSKSRVLKAE